jgi:DNA-binding MarR family transcriptional regulator
MAMDFLKELGYLAIASRMKRLTDSLLRGGSEAYRSLGLDFEPRWFTLFYLLHSEDSPLSIQEIADALKVSHPAVIQTAQMLLKMRLIKSFQDPVDRRKRRLALTAKGKELGASLAPVWGCFQAAATELFEGAGVDMLDAIQRVEAELEKKEMGTRIIQRIKEMQARAVEIVDFSPQYKDDFRKLTRMAEKDISGSKTPTRSFFSIRKGRSSGAVGRSSSPGSGEGSWARPRS